MVYCELGMHYVEIDDAIALTDLKDKDGQYPHICSDCATNEAIIDTSDN